MTYFLALTLFLSGCSIDAALRLKCEGKCEVEVNRSATIEKNLH
jgi:hypothetical protein